MATGVGSVGKAGNAQFAGKYGWAVGNIEFLDSQASRVNAYWREIEQGTTQFVGRRIAGLWGGPGGGGTRAGLYEFGAGDRTAQTLVPFSRNWGVGNENTDAIKRSSRNAAIYLTKHGLATGKRSRARGREAFAHGPTAGTIHQAILPHRMFQDAANAFDPVAAELAALEEAFSGILNPGQAVTRRNVTQHLSAGSVGSRAIPYQLSPAGAQRLFGGSLGTGRFQLREIGSGGTVAFGVISRGAQGVERSGRGTYVQTAGRQLQRANARIALEYAELVAQMLEEERVRKGISTRRLRRAILDPRNRFPQTPAGS